MSNGGLIGRRNQFSTNASGRWGISNVREFNLSQPSGGAFLSPMQAGSLHMHFDFSDTSSITHSGGSVSQVNDLSGNNRHATQSNATHRPVTGQSSVQTQGGSRNVLYFSGNKTLILPAPPSTNGVYFIVGKSDNTSLTKWLLYPTINANNDPGGLFLQQNIVNGVVLLTMSTYFGTSIFSYEIGTNIFLSTYIYSSNYVEARVNKNFVGSYPHTMPANSSPVFLASSNATGANGWEGILCEILFYDISTNSIDVKSIEDYLYNKWVA